MPEPTQPADEPVADATGAPEDAEPPEHAERPKAPESPEPGERSAAEEPADSVAVVTGSGRRDRWVVGALSSLAAVLLVAGAFVLTSGGPAAPAPAAAAAMELPAGEGTPVPKVQPPGTVRLPGGATVAMVREDISATGVLPIPSRLDQATWWGAAFGAEQAPAVLAGHVNWQGKRGPFAELWHVEPGQRIRVIDVAGTKWVYRVTEVHTVHKNDLPAQAERLFGQRGPHRIVLVTCGGRFAGDEYRDNRIVVGTLASIP